MAQTTYIWKGIRKRCFSGSLSSICSSVLPKFIKALFPKKSRRWGGVWAELSFLPKNPVNIVPGRHMDTTNAPSLKQKGSRLKYSGIFIGNSGA